MELRKHDKGFNFPFDREAADAAQSGIEDERLRMDSILLSPAECASIRFTVSRYPEILKVVSSQQLVEPSLIGQLIEGLKEARKDSVCEPTRRKIDQLVTKCLQWQRDDLPVFVDV